MERRDFNNQAFEAHRDECARAASALTALFDGQASAVEFVEAQHHLAECQACATLFQTWKRNRFLLRALPIPAVPAVLLTRVLMAVRLLPFSRGGASLPALPKGILAQAEARDAALLAHTVMVSGANPFAARRRSDQTSKLPEIAPLDANVPLPPNEMQFEILSRTVFAPEAAALQPEARRHSWNLRPALVPALAAFLMLFTGQVRQPELSKTAPLATVTTQREAPQKSAAPIPARREAAAVPVVFDEEAPQPQAAVLPAVAGVVAEPAVAPIAPAVAPMEAFVAATLPFVTDHKPVIRQPESRPAPAISSVSEPLHTRGALPGTPVTRHSAPAPASPAQPHEAASDDHADDADEVISHVARLNDERPDDVRDVVDEFRAALLAANPEDEDNPTES